ncbi:YobA family protein [Mechercharimyces sp. CAU 1602]|uniref:YobA family protein n=1 Tax=Mechercharimyces sp. CAU 1602 TaxID=2973933 RepID=UPI0021616790|nr:YobA family protein [Mechercharimyces sp. CAU 1602]MCS1350995.1 YobA family protein [Mechercharimyces sp. CAU 1602]
MKRLLLSFIGTTLLLAGCGTGTSLPSAGEGGDGSTPPPVEESEQATENKKKDTNNQDHTTAEEENKGEIRMNGTITNIVKRASDKNYTSPNQEQQPGKGGMPPRDEWNKPPQKPDKKSVFYILTLKLDDKKQGEQFTVFVAEGTEILTADGRKSSLSKLATGMRVEVQITGPIAESSPPKGTASKVVLLSDK